MTDDPTLIAIGLDSADPVLVRHWVRQGLLPNIARLEAEGAYCPLEGPDLYLSEQAWTLVATGCEATQTGYWSRWKFDPDTYALRDTGAYDFAEHQPFYALDGAYRSAVFDVPQSRIVPEAHGVQVVAWGARSARTSSGSNPPGLFDELVRRHGRHPAFDRDHASFWNPVAVAWLERALRIGIARRTAICLDLLARERWDYFFTVFGETHSAGHYFWHLSQEHPLRDAGRRSARDPLLAIFRDVDRAVGTILAARPGARVILFSPEGMAANSVDLPSTVFLPELLFRVSFEPAEGLTGANHGRPLPERAVRPLSLAWHRELYAGRADASATRRRLRRWLPMELTRAWERLSDPGPGPDYPPLAGGLFHQPALWYQRHWPAMTCFALPSIAHGYIRVNVRGRERPGLVPADQYDSFCDELASHLRGLRHARTGRPIVDRVVRTRTAPGEAGSRPDADLVVYYDPEPADAVDSPRFGRIGPVPYARTGGHANRGFAIIRAPGYRPGSALAPGRVRDLAPTMVALVGGAVPARLQGRPIVGGQTAPMPTTAEAT